MCNCYGYLAPVYRITDAFSEIRIPPRFKDGAVPNPEPREHIRPTNQAPKVRPIDTTTANGRLVFAIFVGFLADGWLSATSAG